MTKTYNFLNDTKDRNILFNLLFDEKCKELEKKPNQVLHYKKHAADAVDYQLSMFYMALEIDEALKAAPLASISFEFSEEYNVSGMVRVGYTNQDKTEETETIYDSSDLPKEVLDLMTKQQQKDLDSVIETARALQRDDLSEFHESTFSRDNSAIASFGKEHPEVKAFVEKNLLQNDLSETVSQKPQDKNKSKM